jgi:starch synthase (maltosyl-transferring)
VSHASRAQKMGFNWVYLNPINNPGRSGSLYATKDYFLGNPDWHQPISAQQKPSPLVDLSSYIQQMGDLGIYPMADLVINHTSFDCPLIQEHPDWFLWDGEGHVRHPEAVDPGDPSKKTVWCDLAEINNLDSPDRGALWEYWWSVVEYYLHMGFKGFRCDAAYQVPSDLWQLLISRAQSVDPHVVFWAENLGCTIEQTRALRNAGFQLFCNSSKWWNFYDSWCLDQHREFEDLASISFAETHDTERLAADTGGSEAIQRQRYAFAAAFSTGLMMPMGYEFGFRRKLDVVKTRPEDWESPLFDLTEFIRGIHEVKSKVPLLQGEGMLQQWDTHVPEVCMFHRQSSMSPGAQGWIVMNTHASDTKHIVFHGLLDSNHRHDVLTLTRIDDRHEFAPCPAELVLKPSEVVFIQQST